MLTPLRLILSTLVVLVCSRLLSAAEPPEPSWDELKKIVDSNGKVKPGIKETAFRSAVGVRWQLLQPSEKGDFQSVKLTDSYHTGDRFRLRVETLTDATVYVFARTPEGKWKHLNKTNPAWTFKAGEAADLPKSPNYYEFKGEGGENRFRLLCTVAPLDTEATTDLALLLERLTDGKGLNKGEQKLWERLTVVEAKTGVNTGDDDPKTTSPTTGPKGKDIVIVRQTRTEQWHTAVVRSDRAEADSVLAHDIPLKHSK